MHSTLRPTEAQKTAITQRPSVIIHGPAGSGKTLHAPAICATFGLGLLVDPWNDAQPLREGALHLTRQTAQRSRPGVMVLGIVDALEMCRLRGHAIVTSVQPRFRVTDAEVWQALKAGTSAHSAEARAVQYAEDWAAKAEALMHGGVTMGAAISQAEAATFPRDHHASGPWMSMFARATLVRHWAHGQDMALIERMNRALSTAGTTERVSQAVSRAED